MNRLHSVVTKAYKVNNNIKFEVFIHKVDGLTEDTKMETQREIHQRANDDLVDSGNEVLLTIFFFFLFKVLSPYNLLLTKVNIRFN